MVGGQTQCAYSPSWPPTRAGMQWLGVVPWLGAPLVAQALLWGCPTLPRACSQIQWAPVLEAKIGTTATPSNWWAGGPAHWCSVLCVGHAGQNVPPIAAPCACNAENQHALFRNTNWHSCLLRHNSVHCLIEVRSGTMLDRPHPRWRSGNGGAHLALAPGHVQAPIAPCGANRTC